MIRYEKEMIPLIQNFFLTKFQYGYFVKEFKAGIGIADLVFSPSIEKREYYFQNFELLYHTVSLFNKKNKKIHHSDIKSKFSKNSLESLTKKFIIPSNNR